MTIQVSDYLSLNRGGTPGSGNSGTYYVDTVQHLADAIAAGLFSSASLDDIGDVNAPTPNDGEVLTWDAAAGRWVPASDNSVVQAALQADNVTLRLTDADGNNVDANLSALNPAFSEPGMTATNVHDAIVEAKNAVPGSATTTAEGIAELATNAEAQAGTDATRIVTPAALKYVLDNAGFGTGNGDVTGGTSLGGGAAVFKQENASHVLEMRSLVASAPLAAAENADDVTLSISAATDTASGAVELATNAEAQAGTDTSRAITPAALKYVLDNAGFGTGSGDVTGGTSLGGGAAVFKQENASHVLEMRSLVATAPLAATENANDITLSIGAASASAPGAVELASTAEVVAGTDTGRAVTPAGMHDALYSGFPYPPCLSSHLGGAAPTSPGPMIYIDDTDGDNPVLMVWSCAANGGSGGYKQVSGGGTPPPTGSQNVTNGPGSLTNQSATENQAITPYTTPSDLFTWSNGGTISLSASPLPPGVTFTDNGNGTGTFSGTPTSSGSWTTTVTATASDGTTASDTMSWSVAASAPAGTVANLERTAFADIGSSGTLSATTAVPASSDRVVVVQMGGSANNPFDVTQSTMTIGGVTATLVVSEVGASNYLGVPIFTSLWYAVVPTGSDVTVVHSNPNLSSVVYCETGINTFTTSNHAPMGSASETFAGGSLPQASSVSFTGVSSGQGVLFAHWVDGDGSAEPTTFGSTGTATRFADDGGDFLCWKDTVTTDPYNVTQYQGSGAMNGAAIVLAIWA